MRALARYWHTLRPVPTAQLIARAWFSSHRPRPDTRPAPRRSPQVAPYVTPREGQPSLLGPERFCFLNVARACTTWEPTQVGRLWCYNLHYFDDLNAQRACVRADWHDALLERWVAEIPPGVGTGWEPYPLSRRFVNWVKWDLRYQHLSAVCRDSLAVQARWLMQRMEYHLAANHLFANAKALVHAGLYFEGAEAEHWYRRGMRLIERELPVQVLADGGHFERSTMYHASALEDLLDLVNLLRAYGRAIPPTWERAQALMRLWLRAMTHPDGAISFFNDAAFGIAGTASELDAYAQRLLLDESPPTPGTLCTLMPSGYVRASMGAALLLCDCAEIGPYQQPGHAHADTLSFELSLDGQRVCVNSGTSDYGAGQERQRQRGTAAHNTVVVNGEDSSEVWAGFRVARRAHARLLAAEVTSEGVTVAASHDGYRRLPGRNEHVRRWHLSEYALSIVDRITGKFSYAEAHFHLHPGLDALPVSDAELSVTGISGWTLQMRFAGAVSTRVLASTWHPEFGMVVPSKCVVVRFTGPSLETRIVWKRAS